MKAGRLKLFGPVLFYDLIRIARRTRFIVVRTLYVLLLAFILGWLYLVLWLRYGGLVPTTVLAEFANYFFYTYMVIQFVVVVLLTPPYTAGAIAEEKERRTLEFLLATDLRDREIVLGKFMARALNLTILLLAGLPILALLQVLGGVDPGLLLAGFAATLLTMFSLAAISILSSVAMRRARDAIVLVYFSFLGYYLLASLALIFQRNFPGGWTNWPGLGNWTSPVTLGDLVEWLNAGNVGYALFQLASRRTILDQALPGVLRDYALFHGLLGMGCLGLAVWRLRRAALREAEHTGPRPSRKRRAWLRFPIGTMPMLWKEIVAEGSIRLNLLGKIIAGLLVIASFAPVSIILYLYFDGQIRRGWRGGPDWEQAGWEINAFQVRFVGTLVACLLWLAVVVRAAGSISGERDRDTLDNLLTTPLAVRDILLAKWLGAILSVRKGWILLAAIWGVGVLTGALQPLCVPLLAGVWLLYAAGLAGVGLWFSATARRTLRATVGALLTALVLGGGHWLFSGLCCFFPLALMRGGPPRSFDWFWNLLFGQTPALVLGLFAFHGGLEFRHPAVAQDTVKMIGYSIFGLTCWTGVTVVLWFVVLRRFKAATNRTDVRRRKRIYVVQRQPPIGRQKDKETRRQGDKEKGGP